MNAKSTIVCIKNLYKYIWGSAPLIRFVCFHMYLHVAKNMTKKNMFGEKY